MFVNRRLYRALKNSVGRFCVFSISDRNTECLIISYDRNIMPECVVPPDKNKPKGRLPQTTNLRKTFYPEGGKKSPRGKYQVCLEIWGPDKGPASYKLNCSQSKQESEKYTRNICCLWMSRVESSKISHIKYQPPSISQGSTSRAVKISKGTRGPFVCKGCPASLSI